MNNSMIDLASEVNGGRTLLTSDDFFAPKENLLKPGRGVFIEDKYTDHGKWMDGWESRRKRTEGSDWCILRLGIPGIISKVDIDTNHFIGNFPSHASVDACTMPKYSGLDDIAETGNWVEILPKVQLKGNSRNLFEISTDQSYSHIRLRIYPDGGVARFKVYGNPNPDHEPENNLIDFALSTNGGETLSCSDNHFGRMENLIKPSIGMDMRDGWETKRRRGPGHDWVILKLGSPCIIKHVIVDTLHFKGNFPDTCSIEGCFEPHISHDTIIENQTEWSKLLPKSNLLANQESVFSLDLNSPITHIRFNIFPDGGVSRLRILGHEIS